MSQLVDRLSPETITGLRLFGETAENMTWPSAVAARRGWRQANAAYQAEQRAHGRAEMDALLAAAGLDAPLPPEAVADTLLAAQEVFLRTPGIVSRARLEGAQVRVVVGRCPLFDHFVDPTWHGLTACGCFARVEGWYEALGIPLDREVVGNRKWGDPVCEVILHLPTDAAASHEAVAGATPA